MGSASAHPDQRHCYWLCGKRDSKTCHMQLFMAMWSRFSYTHKKQCIYPVENFLRWGGGEIGVLKHYYLVISIFHRTLYRQPWLRLPREAIGPIVCQSYASFLVWQSSEKERTGLFVNTYSVNIFVIKTSAYYIVRPVNRDGTCQTDCHIRTIYCEVGIIAHVRFNRATN